MANERIKPKENEHIVLVTQVNGICPKCHKKIIYDKKNRKYKGYDVAHIYPLNPTEEEIEVLKGVEILGGGNVNHLDNLIPLCDGCHRVFDHPRTMDEYLELLSIKKEAILKDARSSYYAELHIENEISDIIDAIYSESDLSTVKLNYSPLEITKKLNDKIPRPTKKKIEDNIKDYFPLVKEKLKEVNQLNVGSAMRIATQVKLAFLKFEKINPDQVFVYNSLVDWFRLKVKKNTNEGAEILAAFFIQNCEVFDDSSR